MSLFIMFEDQLTPLLGEMSTHHPFFPVAVYAPGTSGVFLVWHNCGLKGLGSFLFIPVSIPGSIDCSGRAQSVILSG
jgi:hypothetical protein